MTGRAISAIVVAVGWIAASVLAGPAAAARAGGPATCSAAAKPLADAARCAPNRAAQRATTTPGENLGGLNLSGYCQSIGYDQATTGATYGPGAAYDWYCTGPNGTAAIAMDAACQYQYPGKRSVAHVEDPNNPVTWVCVAPLPPPATLLYEYHHWADFSVAQCRGLPAKFIQGCILGAGIQAEVHPDDPISVREALYYAYVHGALSRGACAWLQTDSVAGCMESLPR